MPNLWKKLPPTDIKSRVFQALTQNANYAHQNILGVPASYLDDKVFNQDASFVKDAPFISTLAQNPNHIGCHTRGTSEPFFAGTQALERELIEICAVDILGAEENTIDGYVASGGTEANLQAVWIYRNLFRREHGAKTEEIALLCTTDAHYCVDKAADVFSLDLFKVPVREATRRAEPASVTTTVTDLRRAGKKYVIAFANMMTTMFGSVDAANDFADALAEAGLEYRIHVDGAFGGFYHPFTSQSPELSFANPYISSVTLDAHKMAQAPYGTGIFLVRKGLIEYAGTPADYVAGDDFTLIGSRSGANAVAVWMILATNGPYGWREKIYVLQQRTNWLCERLTELGLDFYRNPEANIVTIRARHVPAEVARRYHLVPDNHRKPAWYKVVVMEHVIIEKLLPLLRDLGAAAGAE
ncbi:MAG: pyridoxal-dependent decarboxylase [Bacteroidota bacterium]